MAKTSGGVRTLQEGSREYNKRLKEVHKLEASGKYSSVIFSQNGGGYVAIEKNQEERDPDELKAARILADNGYKIELLTSKGKPNGKKSPEGYLFQKLYDQKTPTRTVDLSSTIKNALSTAREQEVKVVVLYSKNHVFSKEDVARAIRRFEGTSSYRFDDILVVADNGHIHRHKHNK